MSLAPQEQHVQLRDLDFDLDSTSRPATTTAGLKWDGNTLILVGASRTECPGLALLPPRAANSLREHIVRFSMEGKYASTTIASAVRAISSSLVGSPTHAFSKPWLMHALTKPTFRTSKGCIEALFTYWYDRRAEHVEADVLEFLTRPLRRTKRPRNVLSDDPEKSWLTNDEYDALLQRIWENYDTGFSATQVTLLRLLSMQYARRPVQHANLKICDFRNDVNVENGIRERRIHFPGAKDANAESDFRESKEEIHPVADHLWNLFQIQKHNIRALFTSTCKITLTEAELEQVPVFTTEAQLISARDELTEHPGVTWRMNLDSRLFHLSPSLVSKILSWRRNEQVNESQKAPSNNASTITPCSHRTGRPIVINSNRMRHTRARQLARLGMPKHVLSFWLGHTNEESIEAYYNDPAEDARKINEAMGAALVPLAMSFTGKLLDDGSQASRANDPESAIEFATNEELKDVGKCGKHSFCATTTVPIPCYRCKYFEPLVYAPHEEVLQALKNRQAEENAMVRIGGSRNLLMPIDLSRDIRAVNACILRCNARKSELAKE